MLRYEQNCKKTKNFEERDDLHHEIADENIAITEEDKE